jgi:Sec7-like guanine-nucleotide exchange factor
MEHHDSKIEKYNAAIELFNLNPTSNEAQNFLVQNGLINAETVDLEWSIILNTYASKIDKTALGLYLGHINNQEECRSYLQTVAVKGLVVDEALRHLLAKFKLPGEAQHIDRIMELFAGEYLAQNPGAAPNTDILYSLCFAVIMLHVELHSPQVQIRMSMADFVKSASVLPENGGFPSPALLQEIYARIAANPLF